MKKSAVFSFLLAVSVLSFLCAAGQIYLHFDYREDVVSETKLELQKLTDQAARDIEAILRQTMNDAHALADELTASRFSMAELHDRMVATAHKNSIYFGVSITYRPFGFDSDRRLYAPYYNRGGVDGEFEFVQIEDSYDYSNQTDPENDWYVLPMQQGSRWSEPGWGRAGKSYGAIYSSVFYEQAPGPGERSPLGVVTITISLDRIKQLIEDIDLGPSGFGALTSLKGVYLYHPNREFILSKKSIVHLAEEKNDLDRLEMAEMIAKGQRGIIDHISTTTKQPSWLVFVPVPLADWSLQTTFLKKDIEIDVDKLRHQLVMIVVAVLAFLLVSLACVHYRAGGNEQKSWLLTGIGSLFIACGIGCIWVIALSYNPADKISGVRVSDKATLQNIMSDYMYGSREKHLEPPIFVPTGVFIDSIKFSGPSDVLLSGHIWQKYSADFPEAISKEFMISKATNVKINEVDRSSQQGEEVIRSYFEAEIRQKLTHETYPLERERIGLRIIHKELDHNIVLVPDLDAYAILNASLLPGLDKDAFISGWKLTNTYYELRQRNLNTNFGLGQTIERENFPVLYYNIGIQRNFIDAFISNLTPLIIVSIMLFFLLLLVDKFDAIKIFSICVAMFFVLVFSHIDIRSKISAQEIFYLEYFYFLTYGSILFVALDSIGTLLKSDVLLFRTNSRIPQLLFWPVLLGTLFGVTVATFY
jgi:hypothetical protein